MLAPAKKLRPDLENSSRTTIIIIIIITIAHQILAQKRYRNSHRVCFPQQWFPPHPRRHHLHLGGAEVGVQPCRVLSGQRSHPQVFQSFRRCSSVVPSLAAVLCKDRSTRPRGLGLGLVGGWQTKSDWPLCWFGCLVSTLQYTCASVYLGYQNYGAYRSSWGYVARLP